MCFAWEPKFISERRKKVFFLPMPVRLDAHEIHFGFNFWMPTRILNLIDYSVSMSRQIRFFVNHI